MPFFKTPSNEIIFIESLDDQHLLPDGCTPLTDHEVLEPNLLETARKDKWEHIKAERDRRTLESGYKVGTKWFHSDQTSRTQQLGLILMGSNIPSNLMWKTMDGSFVQMTPTLAQQVLAAAASSDSAIFIAAETHKAAINGSLSSDAVRSYDIMTGWPQAYGE